MRFPSLSFLRIQRPGSSSGRLREVAPMFADRSQGQFDLFTLPAAWTFVTTLSCLSSKRRTIRQERWREMNRATWRQEEGEHQLTALSRSHAADWSTPGHTYIWSWRETTRKYKKSREIQWMRKNNVFAFCWVKSDFWILCLDIF